jgi:hypothetical protein
VTTIEVPDELAAQFEDALTRTCFVCNHAVRDHLKASKCHCCSKGIRMPSEVANEAIGAVRDVVQRRRT